MNENTKESLLLWSKVVWRLFILVLIAVLFMRGWDANEAGEHQKATYLAITVLTVITANRKTYETEP